MYYENDGMRINSLMTLNRRMQPQNLGNRLLPWLPIIGGLVVLYAPSLTDLFRGIWSTDQQAHGPIVLVIACWLIYRKWSEMLRVSEGQPTADVGGWVIFILTGLV